VSPFPPTEDRQPHPAPCNWAGGALCVCPSPTLDEPDLSDATQARSEDVARQETLKRWDALDAEPLASSVLAVPASPAYVISDEEDLRRAFGAIRHARRRLDQNKRMQAPEVEALERELFLLKEANARANKALQEEIAHKERAITVYAQLHRKDVLGSETPREGETKTRNYGIGKISYRKAGGQYRWRQDVTAEDEAALLKWATDRTGPTTPLTTLERVIDLEAIKSFALADQSGKAEAPPGLEWVPEGETITVKVGEEK
jgi:phage host-nuclease inhibitor protein Gam